MSIPADLRYTAEHEWVAVVDGQVRVGVTAHAATELGDIVFVELPEVGASVSKGDEVAAIDSTKAASGITAVSEGVITAGFDLAEIARHRAAFGFFRDRRPSLYARLAEDI